VSPPRYTGTHNRDCEASTFASLQAIVRPWRRPQSAARRGRKQMADTQLSATGTYGDGHEQAARDDAWTRRMLSEGHDES
jgi:hypothetical protein